MSDTIDLSWTLGDRIAKARKAAGMRKPIDLARRLRVSDKTIRNWENGVTRPNERDVIAVAQVTGASVDWLDPEAFTERSTPISFPTLDYPALAA